MVVKAQIRRACVVWMLGAGFASAACERKQDTKASLPPPAPKSAESAGVNESQPSDGTVATVDPPANQGSIQQGSATPMEATPPAGEAAQAPANAAVVEPGQTIGGASQPQAVESSYRLTGSVTAQQRSQLAFRVGGFIDQIQAKPGTPVKKDQVLATLQPRDFELRLDLAKARRDQAKVAADNAAKEFQREKQLASENASTPTTFDKVSAAYEQARLALKVAELEVVSAQNALDDAKLRAPFDSVVANQMKDVSENVQAGTAVFEIYGTGEPEINLAAPERLMGQIKVGDEVTVQVPSASFSGKAQVIRIVNVINDKTRTFQVIAKLSTPNDRVVAGSYAEAVMN